MNHNLKIKVEYYLHNIIFDTLQREFSKLVTKSDTSAVIDICIEKDGKFAIYFNNVDTKKFHVSEMKFDNCVEFVNEDTVQSFTFSFHSDSLKRILSWYKNERVGSEPIFIEQYLDDNKLYQILSCVKSELHVSKAQCVRFYDNIVEVCNACENMPFQSATTLKTYKVAKEFDGVLDIVGVAVRVDATQYKRAMASIKAIDGTIERVKLYVYSGSLMIEAVRKYRTDKSYTTLRRYKE